MFTARVAKKEKKRTCNMKERKKTELEGKIGTTERTTRHVKTKLNV